MGKELKNNGSVAVKKQPVIMDCFLTCRIKGMS
jgi:hypothetical protein